MKAYFLQKGFFVHFWATRRGQLDTFGNVVMLFYA